VPLVVGMATNLASLPRSGMVLMRLRMSCKQQHGSRQTTANTTQHLYQFVIEGSR
jgi:hypothetical protein